MTVVPQETAQIAKDSEVASTGRGENVWFNSNTAYNRIQMMSRMAAGLAIIAGSVSLSAVILPGIDRTVLDFEVSFGEPDLATLILPVVPTVSSLVGSEITPDRVPTRITDYLPRFEGGPRLIANAVNGPLPDSGVLRWSLALNSAFASVAYDRFDPMGVTSWVNRLETGMDFGRAAFRPDSFAAVREVESFRTSVEQNPAYSYGAPGF